MEYYALLTTVTVIIAALAALLYMRTREPGILVGTGALYYWSLFGAWYIVIDKNGGSSGKHYQYLETKMFPITLDGDYMLALCLYAAFIVSLQIGLLMLIPTREARLLPRLPIRHEPILLMALVA